MNTASFISFIIPVYNEEENIARMLANLFAVLNTHPEALGSHSEPRSG